MFLKADDSCKIENQVLVKFAYKSKDVINKLYTSNSIKEKEINKSQEKIFQRDLPLTFSVSWLTTQKLSQLFF